MFVGKARGLPYSGPPEKCFTRVDDGLARKHWNRLEKLARAEHSSLLQKFVTYGRKKFYNIGHRTTKLFTTVIFAVL